MQDGLKFYTGFSLVDVTNTGVRRGDSHERQQQRNWETVLQTMGLRSQPLHITDPRCVTLNVEYIKDGFGEMYEGEHKVWVWTWAVDREDIYRVGDDEMGGLLKDFEQVPIINGLDETARFMLPIFYPYGGIKNIHFLHYGINMDNL